MSYETILFDVKDGVATLTFNRPEAMNTWTGRMARELTDAMKECDLNDDIRAVVVTGSGRAFCAGADLSSGSDSFSTPDRNERRDSKKKKTRPTPAEAVFPFMIRKPVIAALNGHAIGVGITYPMMCDMRFVAEDAKIQFAFVRRGVIPELASHVIVARVAGLSRAADLLLSGRMIRGRELAEMGLASAALPAEEVLPAALERARDFVNTAPTSVAISKRLLWEGLAMSAPQMIEREMKLFAWAGNQPDAREGVLAFLEKRPPQWKLRASTDLPEM